MTAGRKIFGDRLAPDGALVADNFDRWFADSRVVDSSGAPLRLYHGTRKDFTVFRTSGDGGSYFTDSTEDASEFARMHATRLLEFVDEDSVILPVYLRMTSPRVLHLDGNVDAWDCGPYFRRAIAAARKRGHDGLIAHGMDNFDAGLTTTYIVFEPRQIKSAIGNSGLFDPHSPDVNDSHGWELQPQIHRNRMRA